MTSHIVTERLFASRQMIAVDSTTISAVAAATAGLASLAAIIFAILSNKHARRRADAAEESARAATKEREQSDADRREAEDATKSATLILRTERELAHNTTFGRPDDPYTYDLVIVNQGTHEASNLLISNLAWAGDHDIPAAADTRRLTRRAPLISGGQHRIRLHCSGKRNSWEISECTVHWEDGLGHHEKGFQVAQTW